MAVVVFGSINTDLALSVATLPKPGETVLTMGYEAVAGGKGCNQAVAAAKLGAEVRMIGCVGGDAWASIPLDAMRAAGVDTSGVRTVDAPTAIAAVMVAESGENSIVVASGANLEVRASDLDGLGGGGVLVCQMEVPVGEIAAALLAAKAAGARTILNLAPAGVLPAEARGAVDYWVVNVLEVQALAEQVGLASSDDLPALTRALAQQLRACVVTTLGARGAVAVQADGSGWRVSALAKDVVDTTGAGDAFVGGLAAALAEAQALPEALKLASTAGGLACTGFGAQAGLPAASEVATVLREISVTSL